MTLGWTNPTLATRSFLATWSKHTCHLESSIYQPHRISKILLLSSSDGSDRVDEQKQQQQQQTQQTQQTLVPGSTYESEYEVKKSRFIGYAKHCKTWTEASEYISEMKQIHPKARHWCYAFRSGASQGVEPLNERCSDDGEPTGTAGAPILGAIQGEELTNVVCVVVRYFGGIKLGAGGLIRAYGASARQVLREAAPYEIVIPTTNIQATVPASFIGAVYDTINSIPSAASTGDEAYGLDGSLTLNISCELDEVDSFRNGLKDATRGQAVFDPADG